ncbi:hypothetical protein PTTG_27214 [Puccinia triticina 1-1 BBBD Race 1]|uniref:Uncharacterized protein n=2 Tax=Puccinia triticina TaxID=208348 RepID=A0A180GMW3_PUCT1|nr:hypothetical protein PTTG_27214 [Puccinia triticina 1-1 BBBD Race 1]
MSDALLPIATTVFDMTHRPLIRRALVAALLRNLSRLGQAGQSFEASEILPDLHVDDFIFRRVAQKNAATKQSVRPYSMHIPVDIPSLKRGKSDCRFIRGAIELSYCFMEVDSTAAY